MTEIANVKLDRPVLHLTFGMYFGLVLFAAHISRGSDLSPVKIEVLQTNSSNVVLVVNEPLATNSSSQHGKGEGIVSLVESNGLYRIEIKTEKQAEEIIPASSCPWPLEMTQVLDIYAKLTDAELQAENDVRRFPGLFRFPTQVPAMTRAQACEFLEKMLRDQAGVEVVHPDDKHVILRLRKKPGS